MMNIQLALDNVVSCYKNNSIEYTIVEQNDEYCVVDVTNKEAPGSLLKIEILYNGSCCVLQRKSVGFRSMKRFMDRLVSEL